MAWLERAAAAANLAADREHVTLWLKRNRALKRVNLDGPGGGLERHRWTLDFAEDLAFFRALWSVMGEGAGDAGTAAILAVLDAHPEIVAINAALVDEPRLADRAMTLDRRVRSGLIAA